METLAAAEAKTKEFVLDFDDNVTSDSFLETTVEPLAKACTYILAGNLA